MSPDRVHAAGRDIGAARFREERADSAALYALSLFTIFTMSLFKQLLTDLSDAASELSTTLTTDLSEARDMTRAELSSSSEAVSAAIGAALLTQRVDWDAEITSHHSSIDEAVHAALVAKMPPQYGAARARVRRVLAF